MTDLALDLTDIDDSAHEEIKRLAAHLVDLYPGALYHDCPWRRIAEDRWVEAIYELVEAVEIQSPADFIEDSRINELRAA